MLPNGRISDLIAKAQYIMKYFCNIEEKMNIQKEVVSSCKNENNVYRPFSSDLIKEGLFEFRKHWRNGEPIIVRDVLKQGTGLSWEPMVTWRALCGNLASGVSANSKSEVKAIDCLASCEV